MSNISFHIVMERKPLCNNLRWGDGSVYWLLILVWLSNTKSFIIRAIWYILISCCFKILFFTSWENNTASHSSHQSLHFYYFIIFFISVLDSYSAFKNCNSGCFKTEMEKLHPLRSMIASTVNHPSTFGIIFFTL